MLSYSELQSDECLSKMIKKAYVDTLGKEIKELIETIDIQRTKIEELEIHNNQLEQKIENYNIQLNSTEYKVALAIKGMMRMEAINTVESHTPSIVKKQVMKHLDIKTETKGYYEEYSGQTDHYHESSSSVEWH